ncbi:MAG: hypothetical protein D6785_12320 [Planctomycetota bacterium]|nr:MAG: hypothetical protein D6785_12320 [Planctomycetota bacterium]
MISMITINLLPPEDRVQQGPIFGMILLFLICVAFIGLTGFGYFALQNVRDDLTDQIETRKKTLEEKRKALQEIAEKENQIQKLLKRQDLILKISMSKINWAEKLYDLAKIVEKHDIWLKGIQLDDNRKVLVVKCLSKGRNEKKVADFRKAIINSRNFFSIFESVEPYKDLRPVKLPYQTKTEEEKWALSFTLTFKLKPQTSLTQKPQQ